MPPEQPSYAPPSTPTPSQPQYDFIVHTGPDHSNPLTRLAGNSLKMRILVAAGGAGILLVLALLFVALLSGGNGVDTSSLTAIAQKQTELARISTNSSTTASQQSTKNFAATMSLSLLSDQQAFVSFLALHGAKPDSSTLARNKSAQTDATLQTAQSNGTYDQAYISLAQAQLTSYEQALQRTARGVTSKSEQRLLGAAYAHAQLLAEQSKLH